MTTNLTELLGKAFVPLEMTREVESARALSDSDVMDMWRDSKYEQTFNQALYDAYLQNRKNYDIDKNDRFDPFDQRYLRKLVRAGKYSHLIRRPINTFKDALDAAAAVEDLWVLEDETGIEEEERQRDLARQRRRKDEHIAHLNDVWRAAVAKRAATLLVLDAEVKAARDAFRAARGKKV